VPIKLSTRKALLIAAYGLLIPVGLALACLALRGAFSTLGDVLVPIAYVSVILFLVRYQTSAFPRGSPPFSLGISIRIPFVIKSLLCLMVAFLWAAIVGSLTSDTRIGNTVAVGPALGFVGVAAYFFYRSFPNPFKQ
jgi:hypothetical protein